jgi:hypothetical protein
MITPGRKCGATNTPSRTNAAETAIHVRGLPHHGLPTASG